MSPSSSADETLYLYVVGALQVPPKWSGSGEISQRGSNVAAATACVNVVMQREAVY